MERVCAFEKCGKVFVTKNPRKVYCCPACSKAAFYRKRVESNPQKNLKWYTKTCSWCGKAFTAKKSSQEYCCKECREAARAKKLEQERLERKARRAAEKARGQEERPGLLMRIAEPDKEREAHIWAKETEGEDMKDPFGEKARETMPSIVPKPRCNLEKDVLAARRTGAKSYGYYMAHQKLGWPHER